MGKGEFFSIAAAASWAVGVIFYKKLGEKLSPTQLNLLKNAFVLCLVAPTALIFESLSPPNMGWQAYALALASGVIGIAVADSLYFYGLNQAGAARMGITGNLFSPMVIVLSYLFLQERLSGVQLVGFVSVMCGVLMVSEISFKPDQSHDAKHIRRGVMIGAVSIFLMAVSIVMMKRVLESQPLFWVSLIRMVGAVIGLLILIAWRGKLHHLKPTMMDGQGWRTLLLAAFVGQYISMLAWLAGYKYTSASVASVLNETASIFIVLLAWWLLREPMTPRKVVGIAFTITGVACMLL